MRVGNFGLMVPEGEERENGYVRLPHGTPYTVRLSSYFHGPADAVVTIDGRPIGEFRLDPRSNEAATATIETPPGDPGRGRLTFYAADTAEGAAAGAASATPEERGLIRVVFKPGKHRPPVRPVYDPLTNPYRASGLATGDDFIPTYGVNAGGQAADLRSGPTPPAREEKTSGGIRGVGLCSFTGNTGRNDARAGVTGLSGRSSQRWHTAPDIDYLPGEEVTITVRLVVVPKVAAVRPLPARANQVPAPVE